MKQKNIAKLLQLLIKETSKKSVRTLKLDAYYVTKVYCSSFLDVAAGTLNWPMIDLLPHKDESLDWAVPAFKCH